MSSTGLEVYRATDEPLNTTDTTVATMTNVPAGTYVFYAKAVLVQNGSPSGGFDLTGTCTLDAGGAITDASQGEIFGSANVTTFVTKTFASAGTVVLKCRRVDQPALARGAKIVAIELSSASRTQVSG